MLQQHLPFTVLKLRRIYIHLIFPSNTLQQHLPFTVLKLNNSMNTRCHSVRLQQHLPFTVLKLLVGKFFAANFTFVATAPTVYGIETLVLFEWRSTLQALQQQLPFTVLKHFFVRNFTNKIKRLQQYLPFTVCAEGCEVAEEQSDDEVHTSQVPERSEGKTKVIWQWCLPFMVLKQLH